MLKFLKSYATSRLNSIKGSAIIVLMFALIPIIILVPLVAIDANLYFLTKAQLQNSLDSAAGIALTMSTDDAYRADKILKVITSESSTNNFVDALRSGIESNFKPLDGYISKTKPEGTLRSDLNAYPVHTFAFVPSFAFTPNPADVTVTYNMTTGKGEEYINGDTLSKKHGLDGDIEIVLTTDVALPSISKLSKFFGGSNDFKAKVTVRSGITGMRLLRSDDFNQSDDLWFN